jgi:hypothetical protein
MQRGATVTGADAPLTPPKPRKAPAAKAKAGKVAAKKPAAKKGRR